MNFLGLIHVKYENQLKQIHIEQCKIHTMYSIRCPTPYFSTASMLNVSFSFNNGAYSMTEKTIEIYDGN
jgi:hypothetical protein